MPTLLEDKMQEILGIRLDGDIKREAYAEGFKRMLHVTDSEGGIECYLPEEGSQNGHYDYLAISPNSNPSILLGRISGKRIIIKIEEEPNRDFKSTEVFAMQAILGARQKLDQIENNKRQEQ